MANYSDGSMKKRLSNLGKPSKDTSTNKGSEVERQLEDAKRNSSFSTSAQILGANTQDQTPEFLESLRPAFLKTNKQSKKSFNLDGRTFKRSSMEENEDPTTTIGSVEPDPAYAADRKLSQQIMDANRNNFQPNAYSRDVAQETLEDFLADPESEGLVYDDGTYRRSGTIHEINIKEGLSKAQEIKRDTNQLKMLGAKLQSFADIQTKRNLTENEQRELSTIKEQIAAAPQHELNETAAQKRLRERREYALGEADGEIKRQNIKTKLGTIKQSDLGRRLYFTKERPAGVVSSLNKKDIGQFNRLFDPWTEDVDIGVEQVPMADGQGTMQDRRKAYSVDGNWVKAIGDSGVNLVDAIGSATLFHSTSVYDAVREFMNGGPLEVPMSGPVGPGLETTVGEINLLQSAADTVKNAINKERAGEPLTGEEAHVQQIGRGGNPNYAYSTRNPSGATLMRMLQGVRTFAAVGYAAPARANVRFKTGYEEQEAKQAAEIAAHNKRADMAVKRELPALEAATRTVLAEQEEALGRKLTEEEAIDFGSNVLDELASIELSNGRDYSEVDMTHGLTGDALANKRQIDNENAITPRAKIPRGAKRNLATIQATGIEPGKRQDIRVAVTNPVVTGLGIYAEPGSEQWASSEFRRAIFEGASHFDWNAATEAIPYEIMNRLDISDEEGVAKSAAIREDREDREAMREAEAGIAIAQKNAKILGKQRQFRGPASNGLFADLEHLDDDTYALRGETKYNAYQGDTAEAKAAGKYEQEELPIEDTGDRAPLVKSLPLATGIEDESGNVLNKQITVPKYNTERLTPEQREALTREPTEREAAGYEAARIKAELTNDPREEINSYVNNSMSPTDATRFLADAIAHEEWKQTGRGRLPGDTTDYRKEAATKVIDEHPDLIARGGDIDTAYNLVDYTHHQTDYFSNNLNTRGKTFQQLKIDAQNHALSKVDNPVKVISHLKATGEFKE